MAQNRGIGAAYVTAGFVLFWSGLHNLSVKDTVTGFLRGQIPTGPPGTAPTLGVTENGSADADAAAGTTDSAIANDALRYQGHPYSYGGYYHDPAGWDCSSFVNWVLGHDQGLTLPGGVRGYTGTSHGPITGAYLLAWSRYRVSGGADAAAAGDLCVWPTHMGIALGGGQMISALNAQLGTKVTTISGGAPPVEPLTVIKVPGT